MHLVAGGLVGAYSDEEGVAYVDLARAYLIDAFLGGTCDAAFFIDDDMSSLEGVDLLKAMISVDQPIVAMTYLKRKRNEVLLDAIPDEQPFQRNGETCMRIASTGLGCCLIQRYVLEKMVSDYDHLRQRSEKDPPRTIVNLFIPTIDEGIYYGDDANFFRRARASGFPVHTLLNHSLSHDGRAFTLRV
jgi:hypothetical protein